MTPYEFRLYLLSPAMISAGVKGMTQCREDMARWLFLLYEAERSVRDQPLPEAPAAPALRWTCRPNNGSPELTVEALRNRRHQSYIIGGVAYHAITGRSSAGRAVFHGRLWDPPAQERALNAWITARERARVERDTVLLDAHLAHRAAIAERLPWVEREERRPPYDRARLWQRFSDEFLEAQDSWTREKYVKMQWVHLDRWIPGYPGSWMDAGEFNRGYRPVGGK